MADEETVVRAPSAGDAADVDDSVVFLGDEYEDRPESQVSNLVFIGIGLLVILALLSILFLRGRDDAEPVGSETGADAGARSEGGRVSENSLFGVTIEQAIGDGRLLGNSTIETAAATPEAAMRTLAVAVAYDDADLLAGVVATDTRMGDLWGVVSQMRDAGTVGANEAREFVVCERNAGSTTADCGYEKGVVLRARIEVEQDGGRWRVRGWAPFVGERTGGEELEP